MKKFEPRIAISSLFFIQGLCFSAWASRIPSLQDSLQLSESQLGSTLFFLSLGTILSTPVANWLISKWGSRMILVGAMSLYALILTLIGVSTSMYLFCSLLLFFGMAGNTVNISLNTQAVQCEAKCGNPIMASLHGLWSLAGFAGALIGLIMSGAQVAPVWHFSLMLIITIIGTTTAYNSLFTKGSNSNKPAHSKLFKLNGFLFNLGLISFCVVVCEATMYDWSGVYFKQVLKTKGQWVGIGYVAFMATMAGTRFIADKLKERYGISPVLYGSGCAIFLGLMISVLFPSIVPVTLAFLIVGSGVSSIAPLILSAAGRNQEGGISSAISTVYAIGFSGALVGPVAVGWLADLISLQASFAVVALLGICIIFLTYRTSRIYNIG